MLPPGAAHPPDRRPWLKYLAITAGLLALVTVALGVVVFRSVKAVMPEGTTVAQMRKVIQAATVEDPAKIAFGDQQTLNILVLGIDYDYTDKDQPFSSQARSDSIMVLQLRRDGNYIGLLSMPRDMYVEFPNGSHDKVNAAFSTGGVKLEKQMLSEFLGVDFDNYAVIRIDAATKIIDRVGGLDVDVDKNMNYDDNWGHLHVHLKKGHQHLNGEQAVGFARFRHDEEGDRGRMRRQRIVINGMLDKLKASATSDPMALLTDLAKITRASVQTDLPTDKLVAMGKVFMNFDKRAMKTAQLDGADGFVGQMSVIFPPPADKVQKIVSKVIRAGDHESTAMDVEILNGSKVPGAGRKLQTKLEDLGFHVIYVTDAFRATPQTMAVVYNIDGPQRSQLSTSLGSLLKKAVQLVDPSAGSEWQNNPNFADVTIVLGADYQAMDAAP